MILTNESELRKEFKNILFDLAKSQDLFKDPNKKREFYIRLEDLYYRSEISGRKFRHFYSDIFSVLSNIVSGEKEGDIDVLGQNLSEIRKGYQSINKDADTSINIKDKIDKLYDHVNLDIARLNYSKKSDVELTNEEKIKELHSKLNQINNQLNNVSDKANDVEKDLKETQKEHITILGIFSSVVLTFVSGIIFSTSVLQNIDKVSIYRLLLIVDVLALSLSNAMYYLMRFICLINDKDKEIFPIWKFNVVCFLLAFVIFIMWYFGMHGISSWIGNILDLLKNTQGG